MTHSDEHPQNPNTHVILSQLKDIASAVMYAAEAVSLEQVLETIAEVSKDLVNAKYAALGVPDGKGGLRFFKISGMTPEQVARLDHLPFGKGLIGAIMDDRASIRLDRMADDSRSAGFCRAHPAMTSLLGVPIQVGQQLFGTLYLCDRKDGLPFSEDDVWLIETVAGYAALAIAGSQLNEQQQRLTLLEERERIGMDLHDGVIQSLYAMGMRLDLMRLSGDIQPEAIPNVIDNLNEVIEDIRRYIMNLQRRDVPQQTIRQTLADIISKFHTADTVKIELDAPDVPPRFTATTFEAIGQMVNEAVSNAVRHSEATVIRVSADRQERELVITVADNGKGFDPEHLTHQDGLGLRNMRQRAALHGARVEVETELHEGTRLTIRVPVQIL
ncbi:MAG TPA: GAF domain-containing sensor histidine kinase [Terriglobales bacterium]|nr:GAF domain-containing sensor histidine kinase [Terriglobales bacterium]